MIPKKIHYIWFGGKKTLLAKKCIKSWKKHCPDYEIIEWNEQNFDVTKCKHCAQAYKSKKYAFVVDYARYDILYNHGGIYLDTDVKMLKPPDDLLQAGVFVGFEDETHIATGQIIAAEAKSHFIKELMELYQGLDFINADGSLNLTTSTEIITKLLVDKYGLIQNNTYQEFADIKLRVYPSDFFQPIKDGKLFLTDNTYSIHYFSASWLDKDYSLRKKYFALYGKKFGAFLYMIRHPFKSIKWLAKRK
jgi:mannosyltransferase OCH1-like enzyme